MLKVGEIYTYKHCGIGPELIGNKLIYIGIKESRKDFNDLEYISHWFYESRKDFNDLEYIGHWFYDIQYHKKHSLFVTENNQPWHIYFEEFSKQETEPVFFLDEA